MAKQLLDEERIAVSLGSELGYDPRRGRLPTQSFEHPCDIARRESSKRQLGCFSAAHEVFKQPRKRGPEVAVAAAMGADQEDRNLGVALRDMAEEIERRGVGPVQILHDYHGRTFARAPCKKVAYRVEQDTARCPWFELRGWWQVGNHSSQLGKHPRQLGALIPDETAKVVGFRTLETSFEDFDEGQQRDRFLL